ncbi:hypothetical protein PHYBLDRAFT_69232 [Phycomyces blakesleeanus NRRL 1555(-)]|uniref:Uncharacterized protein n=1 Tax=Phycomyces blakesleeanus (strain ATCC 8743b / DSM 1359 / FGSC 10004 / NBRC 33097 / NRRL 1555) TaxID=763407 RepID=A0A163D238_PHYB8|nr:hypothetical protein PHYBLDRAFT_69232 [Phycomyces blakesleeanus NRRL 1555(-)]OAD68160.1 hypothetical protein PHYBLDRAFT_69232 [Phycomyces blakesleeanus NRRL 1555(-)]|eukprot:XP_018286200.1 hypothetical protein PHYBLDRAFT_69232 [Phycomyces blakesleeanus NRRL 1555(-)]
MPLYFFYLLILPKSKSTDCSFDVCAPVASVSVNVGVKSYRVLGQKTSTLVKHIYNVNFIGKRFNVSELFTAEMIGVFFILINKKKRQEFEIIVNSVRRPVWCNPLYSMI